MPAPKFYPEGGCPACGALIGHGRFCPLDMTQNLEAIDDHLARQDAAHSIGRTGYCTACGGEHGEHKRGCPITSPS
jgi:hypothetical protein